MIRLLALSLVVAALGSATTAAADGSYRSSVRPLSAELRGRLQGESWRSGCPVPLSGLRVLTVTHLGFDGRRHTGQLVVNAGVASGLVRVFRRLYELRFPIRHMRLADMYGPRLGRPRDGDVTAAFGSIGRG